jgi:hypothetical protein
MTTKQRLNAYLRMMTAGVITAAALSLAVPSTAMAQFTTGNNFAVVSNGDDSLRIYSGSETSPGSYQYALPLTPGATQYGVTFDHEYTGAYYILENNTIRVMFDTGTSTGSQGPTWNIGYQGYDIAYRSQELFVTRRDNTVSVYNAHTGQLKRTMTVNGASALHGIDYSDNYDGQLTVGDWNQGTGGSRISSDTGAVTTQYYWGDSGGLAYRYNGHGYFWAPARNDSATLWWANSNGSSNASTGSMSGYQSGESQKFDWTYTGSTNRFVFSEPNQDRLQWYNNGQWGQSRTDSTTVNEPTGLYYKFRGNAGSNAFIYMDSMAGLNDVTINADGTTEMNAGSGTTYISSADDAIMNVGDLVSGLGGSNANVIAGFGSSGSGSGNMTLAAAIDFNGMASDRTLRLTTVNDLVINSPISDSDTGTSTESLSVNLQANASAFNGTGSGAGQVQINQNIALNSGDFSASGNDVIVATGNSVTGRNVTINAQDTISGSFTGTGSASLTAGSTAGTYVATGGFTMNVASAVGTYTASAGGITVNGTNVDYRNADVNVTGAAVFNTSTTTGNTNRIGDFNSGNVSFNNAKVSFLGVTNVANVTVDGSDAVTIGAGGNVNSGDISVSSGLINVAYGGSLDAANVNQTGGTFNISGGTFSADNFESTGGDLNFYSGTVRFGGDVDIVPAGTLEKLLGGNNTLLTGRTVTVVGDTNIVSGLTLNGGTLNTGSLTNSVLLNLQKGTVNITADNLVINDGGELGGTLGAGQIVNVKDVTKTLTIGPSALVTLNGGRLTSDAAAGWTNNGIVSMNNETSELGGLGTFNNANLVKGTGRIMTNVNNQVGAELRVENGDEMYVGGTMTNSGLVSFKNASFELEGPSENAATGVITGSGGSLHFANVPVNPQFGAAGLVNNGQINITGSGSTSQATDVYGTIFQDAATAKIIVSGGTLTTFHNDVYNYDDAELKVSGGSAAVFFGTVKGAGDITGAGAKFFEGELDPGQSPGELSIEGDVTLGNSATLNIELGGYNAGVNYDVLSILGKATLDGNINFAAIDGFEPQVGDTFDIINYQAVEGAFDSVVSSLGVFTLNYGATGVSATFTAAVPEPGTLAGLGLGALGLLIRRRRQA